MKKRVSIILSVLCVVVLASVAFANADIATFLTNTEINETDAIQEVINNSNVVASMRNVKTVDVADDEDDGIATYSVGSEFDYINAENAIKVYEVNDIESSDNVQLDDEKFFWIIPVDSADDFSFIYVEKGQDASSAIERINGLNISREWKEQMIAEIKEQEGKWYVKRISSPASKESGRKFVDVNYVNNILENNNITDIKEAKYVRISGVLSILIEKEDETYVIPYNNSEEPNKVYTISEFKELL